MSTLSIGHHRFSFIQDFEASIQLEMSLRQLSIWVKFREKPKVGIQI